MAGDIEEAGILAIKTCCAKELERVLLAPSVEEHYGILLSFVRLGIQHPQIAEALSSHPVQTLELLDTCLSQALEATLATHPLSARMCMKPNSHIRLHDLPQSFDPTVPPHLRFSIKQIGAPHVNKLLCISGTVVRTSAVRLKQSQSVYQCMRCQFRFAIPCHPQGGPLPPPDVCPRPGPPSCSNTRFVQPEEAAIFTNHQEIRVQEKTQCLAMGAMPASITVVLEHDLAEACQAGDEVDVTGVVQAKWLNCYPKQRCSADLVLVASHIKVTPRGSSGFTSAPVSGPQQIYSNDALAEAQFLAFWQQHEGTPLVGRNTIVASFCPQVHGLFLVKLAAMLSLIGGVRRIEPGGSAVRGELHLLLVGDPGTGKSQIMKFAARVAPRAVVTTGKGSTGAGLTVTATKEDGQWVLEAGALVLADGGLCCIDEFDGIKECDRAMIHEAMEQQTLHVAKAGMMRTLSTRTTVLGVMNPKGKYRKDEPLAANISMGGPLLSRFDIALVLLDTRRPDWDHVVSHHVLSAHMQDEAGMHHLEQQEQQTTEDDASDDEWVELPCWPIAALRQYINWAKRFKPVLSGAASQVLQAYYQRLRVETNRCAARTTIRMLESLVRITQAHSRLMARHVAELQDAVTAVIIVEASQHAPIIQGFENALNTCFAEDPDEDYQDLEEQVLKALGLVHLRGASEEHTDTKRRRLDSGRVWAGPSGSEGMVWLDEGQLLPSDGDDGLDEGDIGEF